jgi:two-component system sensor histidine kinase PilS (NtrC family)
MIPDVQTLLTEIATSGILDRRHNWYVFRVFNLYRLILVTILLGVFFLDEHNRFFGKTNPQLFLVTATVYIVLVLLSIAGSYWRRPILKVQAHIQTLVDLISLSLFIHASGGIASNLSILMVTAVAVNGILLPLYSALTTSALAFFILLGFELYPVFMAFPAIAGTLISGRESPLFDYLLTYSDQLERLGILGASCFIAVLLTYTLAERARRSEALVRQRSQQLLNMAHLNQVIVQHLQSGIIVVDQFAQIRLMNDTARRLLNHTKPAQGMALNALSPPLSQCLSRWFSSGLQETKPFRQSEHLPDLTVTFSRLSGDPAADTLIALEDSSLVAQRLQQIKLAALGRMTAGIAHEIRNPLASISHAAQLLQESATAAVSDRRLGQIIYDNTKRANKIITNVLELSRRDRAKPENFALRSWLEDFCREFLRAHSDNTPQLELAVQPPELAVYFDPVQLHQVLWNLCNNACLHGAPNGQTPRLRLLAGLDTEEAQPFIAVYDFGPGIAEGDVKKIFEPFFTTRAQGTGLGLYIAREICEANSARLQYIRPPEGGSCFRITFAASTYEQEQPRWTRAMP